MDQQQIVENWVEKIWDAYNSERRAAAVCLAEQALSVTDNHPKLLEISGILAFERKQFDVAITRICEAMFQISLSIAGQLVLARAWLQANRREDAEMTLEFLAERIEHVPCNLLPDLTHTLANIERDDLALATCRAAFDRHPEDDNAAFGVAFYMHRCGYPDELVKGVIAKAIELNPESHVYRVNMASVCCSLNQWSEAYQHACRLPVSSLQTIPCRCIAKQLKELFVRFDDRVRLDLVTKNEIQND